MPNCTCSRPIRKPGETQCYVCRGVDAGRNCCPGCGKQTRTQKGVLCRRCRVGSGVRFCMACGQPILLDDGAQRCAACEEKREAARLARGRHRPDIGIEAEQVVKRNVGPRFCGWCDNGSEPCGREILVLGVDGWYRPGGIAVCLEHEAAYSRKMQETT